MRRDRLWSESWTACLSERLEDREGGEDSSEGGGERGKSAKLPSGDRENGQTRKAPGQSEKLQGIRVGRSGP